MKPQYFIPVKFIPALVWNVVRVTVSETVWEAVDMETVELIDENLNDIPIMVIRCVFNPSHKLPV